MNYNKSTTMVEKYSPQSPERQIAPEALHNLVFTAQYTEHRNYIKY
jgi:hypothetical protein